MVVTLSIRVWDSRSSSRVPSKHITGYVYFALCLSLSPTNEHLIASGCKGFDGVGSEVKIFDLRATAKPLCNLSFHRHDVTGCSFTPDGTHLVSASKDGSICAWNVDAAGAEERAAPVASHVTHAKLYTSISVGNSPAGAQSHQLFVGAFDGSVSTFSLVSKAGADPPLLLPGNSSQPFFTDGFDDANES
jgi:WD40 repeat protein